MAILSIREHLLRMRKKICKKVKDQHNEGESRMGSLLIFAQMKGGV